MQSGIQHLVVWLKTRLETEEGQEGDLTLGARALVEGFVRRRFVSEGTEESFREEADEKKEENGEEGRSSDKVMWFKNWPGLQSVRGIEHVHVLVRDVPEHVLQTWLDQT